MAQAFIGTYTVIGISWMFTYFRDSFITKQDVYRWAESIEEYKEGKRSRAARLATGERDGPSVSPVAAVAV